MEDREKYWFECLDEKEIERVPLEAYKDYKHSEPCESEEDNDYTSEDENLAYMQYFYGTTRVHWSADYCNDCINCSGCDNCLH